MFAYWNCEIESLHDSLRASTCLHIPNRKPISNRMDTLMKMQAAAETGEVSQVSPTVLGPTSLNSSS